MINIPENTITNQWKDNSQTIVVSINCLVYNHEEYLEKALDSFLIQRTTFPFEIIIGEDRSCDSSLNIIHQYKEKYPSLIKLITSDKNVGMHKNSWRVINASKGKYIAFCEGDDYWIDRNKLQVQIDELEMRPDCNMSFHPSIIVENNLEKHTVSEHHDMNHVFSLSEVIKGGAGFCQTSSLILRKSVVEKGFPEMYYDAPVCDYYWQIIGAMQGGALYINKTMSAYRVNSSSSISALTRNNIDKMISWRDSSLIFMDRMDSHLNNKFTHEISYIKSQIHYALALTYLKASKYKQFKNEIELSHGEFKLNSIKYKITYLMRFFPNLLNFIKTNLDNSRRKLN